MISYHHHLSLGSPDPDHTLVLGGHMSHMITVYHWLWWRPDGDLMRETLGPRSGYHNTGTLSPGLVPGYNCSLAQPLYRLLAQVVAGSRGAHQHQ